MLRVMRRSVYLKLGNKSLTSTPYTAAVINANKDSHMLIKIKFYYTLDRQIYYTQLQLRLLIQQLQNFSPISSAYLGGTDW